MGEGVMVGSQETAGNRGSASATVVAGVAGGDRFRLETGRSGARHVFTRIDGAIEAADVAGTVVLLRADDRRVWVGPGEWLRPDRVPCGAEVLVHWLAETPAERARVVADLDLDPIGAEPTRTGASPRDRAMAA